ncbi:MAG: AraC family transcriptional regulator [Paludibacter sp.]|nr:AraC family transcriptional regulator [Paludibacter sp.]
MDKLFHMFEVTGELVKDLMSKPDNIHFHDFEELIIVTEGSLEHYIDFQVEVVKAPFASYISMGKMHKIVPHEDFRGWVINYQNEFIPDSKINFYSNFFNSTNIPISPDGCTQRFVSLCEIINTEYNQSNPDLVTIRYLTNGLISMIEAERKKNIPEENTNRTSQIVTFNNFLRILEANYHRDEGVTFYADKMNMSERNLNIICKNNFQKSVSEIIETRKLIEAKNQLIHTNKSVSEIGFDLGYNEKSYFTRVFHNKTSVTPTQFREMTRSIIS